MSVRTKTVAAPGRVARRAQQADRVRSGAAQRAYERRKLRAEAKTDGSALPKGRTSAMSGRIPFVAAIIALLGCGLAATLLLTTRAAEDSYQLSSMRETNRKLSDQLAMEEREVAAGESAPELASRAQAIGMVPATDPARILIGPDGGVTVIGDPKPAEGAPAPPLSSAHTPPPGQATPGERVVPAPAPGAPGANAPAPNAAPAPNGGAANVPVPAPNSPAPAPQQSVPAPTERLDVAPMHPDTIEPQLSGPEGVPEAAPSMQEPQNEGAQEGQQAEAQQPEQAPVPTALPEPDEAPQ